MNHEGRSTTQNSKFINASPKRVYAAFTDPTELIVWLAPGEMTAEIHSFEARVGGGYEMSLRYPSTESGSPGKTADREDRFFARYVELEPAKRIVQEVEFASPDPAFAGTMKMKTLLEPEGQGTTVTMTFSEIPPGINPEDNEKGTEMSLEKLARLVEKKTKN